MANDKKLLMTFSQMKTYRAEAQPPAPFEESVWTEADRRAFDREYRRLGNSISDEATKFLAQHGFAPGGLKKLK